jgi:hypothetical protein
LFVPHSQELTSSPFLFEPRKTVLSVSPLVDRSSAVNAQDAPTSDVPLALNRLDQSGAGFAALSKMSPSSSNWGVPWVATAPEANTSPNVSPTRSRTNAP